MFNKHLIPNTQNLSEGQALNIKVATGEFLITKQQGEIIAYENNLPQHNKCSNDQITIDSCQWRHLKRATVGIEKGNCYLLLA